MVCLSICLLISRSMCPTFYLGGTLHESFGLVRAPLGIIPSLLFIIFFMKFFSLGQCFLVNYVKDNCNPITLFNKKYLSLS